MTLRNMKSALAVIAALTLVLAPVAARSDTVGSAAAVKPASTGTPPGGSARTLKPGTSIVDRERIRTSGSGSLQVMFLDKTTMTIGPNSDVVIDEFVYRPGGGGNQFVASMTKGALRFVGGQISHNQGATITTPTATIGIRGGVALVTHDAKCQNQGNRGKQCTKVVCVRGQCSVRSLADSRNFQLRINQAVEIGAIGATQPFDVTSVRLNDVAKGGDTGIVAGKAAASTPSFTGQETIDQTITGQTPEPNSPSPTPPPNSGPPSP
jgi:hypothetical protein